MKSNLPANSGSESKFDLVTLNELFDACEVNVDAESFSTWLNEVEQLREYDQAALFFLCHERGYFWEDAILRAHID